MSPESIVYTYSNGATPPCHAYGPVSSDEAETIAAELRAETPSLTVMVLPLEPAPTPS